MRRILENIIEVAPDAYVVGGAVRDTLLGRPSPADLDLAVKGDGFALARRLASLHGMGATFVPLDRTTGTGRIVLWGDERATLDISSFKGPTIREDLYGRDFTINALAVTVQDFLQGAFHCLVDPTGGLDDIRGERIRACAANTFQSDPLRILRAFRFKASLDFQITEDTRGLMARSVHDLAGVSQERIRDELFAILSPDSAAGTLDEMEASGIVSAIFPDIKAMKGCPQNRYHHLDVWGHTLEAIQRLEEIAHRPTRYFGNMGGRIEPYLKEELVPARSKAALLKIAVLFHDIGKPQARTVDEEGRIRFFGHEKISRRIFEHVATRLKLARREIKLVGEWVGGHMRTMIFTREPVSRRAIYRLHRAFGEDILGLLLLFLADLAATRGPASRPNSEELALRYVREALTEAIALRRQPRQRFLNGRDLMALFELQPGPRLGALLKKLDELQGIGEIQSREEAIEVISRLVTENEVTE